MAIQRVAILGVGLIGGSLGMAIKKDGLAEVYGVDVDAEALQLAQEQGAIDAGFPAWTADAAGVDLVVLAAPITVNLQLLQSIQGQLRPGTIVTDVGSTKGDMVRCSEQLLQGQCHFVGGHPMAGSEIGGIRGADPYLFENAIYVLTPTEDTDSDALASVRELVERIGAKVVILDPNEHDILVASVSHLPHLIASTLVNTAANMEDDHPQILSLAAGGFRDTTRIASGNPQLWNDICFSNREPLLAVIARFKHELQTFEDHLRHHSEEEFTASLASAKHQRDRIPARLKGYWPFLEQIVVTIPDKPGTIAQVASILGEQGINIDDIEILRVREGEGGTLRLGFAARGSADRAVEILSTHGFGVRVR